MPSTQDRCSAIGIYKVPPSLSKEAFVQKCEELMDAVVASPIARNLLRYEMLIPNENLGEHLDTLGMPSVQGTVVIVAEFPSHETLTEILSDPGVKKIIANAKEGFGFHIDSTTFTADVITKIKK